MQELNYACIISSWHCLLCQAYEKNSLPDVELPVAYSCRIVCRVWLVMQQQHMITAAVSLHLFNYWSPEPCMYVHQHV